MEIVLMQQKQATVQHFSEDTIKKVLPLEIFRAYDIRGIVGQTLTEQGVYLIGQALGTLVLEAGAHQLFTGRDGRLSGPSLMQKLQQGILSSGCDVIDIGAVPTPLLYFAASAGETSSGVMLTGSHNPKDYNGLKMVINGTTLSEQAVQDLYQRIMSRNVRHGSGQYMEQDVRNAYIESVASFVQLKRPLKVVLDAGNGIPGSIAPELFKRLGCEVVPLYCEVDGHFPNHHPDPTRPENVVDLIRVMQETKADIGLGFDGDGDRLGVVTPSGKIIWADRQMMLFSKSILARNPGRVVVYDVKCSKHLGETIRAAGGIPYMYKTGHSLMKNKLKSENAILAGEMSGHIFFNERWFGFDDGLYTGARLLEILSERPESADVQFSEIPEAFSTPEIMLSVTEENKFAIMDDIVSEADFPGAECITIDGLRVEFQDGWALVRASNTSPKLVCRFEANTQDALDRIQKEFHRYIDPIISRHGS
jgi:phosphomannomutase / phosphoglucomutase